MFMAKWSFLLGALGAVAYVTGPLVANLRMTAPMTGFSIFLAGSALGVLGLLLGIAAAIRAPDAPALTALGLCALIVLPVAGISLWARRYPPINDITTNRSAPPQFTQTAKLPESRGMNFDYPGESFAQQQQAAYPDLQALPVNLTPSETFEVLVAAAEEELLWKVTVIDGLTLSLEGFEESTLFRFRDDFVIEARPAPGGSLVEMRSRSRDGRGDLGVNARRIQHFFSSVQSKTAAYSTTQL